MGKVLTGLDHFKEGYWKRLKGLRLGLLANQASVDSQLTPAKEVIAQLLPGQLRALFGPQHGHEGQDQDNMVETDHSHDRDLNIPIFSLYSQVREPSPEMLELIDVMIVDLQEVGTRVYTFASTVLNCLKAASKAGKKVLILDRPNPLGGQMVEGNILRPELESFVGPYSLPMRHGLTMGELTRIFDDAYNIHSDLEILSMVGWHRHMIWQDTALRWIMPSPNMPVPATAQVYPGQVIWEGTNVSEGRGTCRPFEIFGAPFLDTKRLKQRLVPEASVGCRLQEISFRPTFHKWKDEICRGFILHIIDPHAYQPYFTTIALLTEIIKLHGDRFKWREPPYEYEYERMPIDMILGDLVLREEIQRGANPLALREKWVEELKDFLAWRSHYLLYR